MKWTLVLGGLCAAAALVSGCRDARVASVWRGDRVIAIDGKKADWNGLGVYEFEDKKVYLGLANDAESLYLVLVSQNREAMMQGLTRGFRVRFRPENGSGLLWVGCPRAAGFTPGRMGPGGEPPARGGDGAPSARFDLTQGGPGDWGDPDDQGGDDPGDMDRDPEGRRGPGGHAGQRDGLNEKMIQTLLDDLPKEIEIYTQAGGDSLRLSSAEAARRGIEEAMGLDEGYLVLEMRVPLVRDMDHPQAIGLSPGLLAGGAQEKDAASVEVNFLIPKREAGDEREGRRGGGEGMPPGGGGGMPPGGGTGMQRSGTEHALPRSGLQFDQDFPGGGGGGGGFPGGGGPRGGGMGRPGAGRPGMTGIRMNGLDMTIHVELAVGPESTR
jgi:hypothetical protein